MDNVAIITAKGGSRELPDKNTLPVLGKPLVAHVLEAALAATHISAVAISTECPKIKAIASAYPVTVIDRPLELAQDMTNHGDVILHAAKAYQTLRQDPVGHVCILLGNTTMVSPEDIDAAVEQLDAAPEADSCMTVWKSQDDHPYRAMRVNAGGYLEGFLDLSGVDSNRQSYPAVVFYDQGPWVVRYASLLRAETLRHGPACWWWMGKCVPLERPWTAGRDVHNAFDLEVAEWWLRRSANPRKHHAR
jgi:CMP-N-acetylneuraminic acid synthetase